MLKRASLIAAKDLRLVASGGQGISQAVLLGLLLIFVFSLSRPTGEPFPAQSAAAVFWLATSFSLVLIFNTLYGLEEVNGVRTGLILSPMPTHSVWLGKACAGWALLLTAQLVFAPATAVFLGQSHLESPLAALALIAGVDFGLVSLGSLLGALAQGQAARESMLSVIVFPLLIPLLLAGIRVGAGLMSPDGAESVMSWAGLILAYDAVFGGAALLLFPFVYGGDD